MLQSWGSDADSKRIKECLTRGASGVSGDDLNKIRSGCRETLNKAVLDNLALIPGWIIRYGENLSCSDPIDYFQELVFALRGAILDYQPERGALSTLFYFRARSLGQRYTARCLYGYSVKPQLFHAFKSVRKGFNQSGKMPDRPEGITELEYRHAVSILSTYPVSLDAITESGVSISDTSEDNEQDPDEHKALRENVSRLPERLRDVISRLYGIGREPERACEIAQSLGCSSTWVSQLEKQGLSALRKMFHGKQSF